MTLPAPSALAPAPLAPAALSIGADDYFALLDLFARYAWALDTGDLDALMALFIDDAWIEDPPQGRLHGLDGVRRFLWGVIDRPVHRQRQHVVQPRLVLGGPQACEVRSFWLVSDQKQAFAQLVRRGTYVDQCVKTPQGWRFASRCVRYWHSDRPPPQPGQPFQPLSTLPTLSTQEPRP